MQIARPRSPAVPWSLPMSARSLSRRSLIRRGSVAAATAGAGVVGGVPRALAAGRPGGGSRERTPLACKDVVIPLVDLVIAAKVIGTGDETIVVHPSLGRGASDLDAMARRLGRRGYRVITFDPRGCGQTKTPDAARRAGLDLHDLADDMLAVIGHFELERTHVLGHAFGNRVTRQLAVDHPGVVDSVILCACGAGIPPAAALPDFLTATGDTAPVSEFKRAVKTSFFGPRSDPKPWFVGWYSEGVGLQRLASLATAVDDYEGGGGAPMLIVQGTRDVIAPVAVGHGLRRKYGADRITIRNLSGFGHAFPIEVPGRTARVIDRYLRRPERNR